MTKSIVTILLGLMSLTFIGCDDDNGLVEDPVPATPQGVYSITGDGVVWVYWNGIYERDVRTYNIYRSRDSITGFTRIGAVAAVDNPRLNLLIYEYAVEAVPTEQPITTP
jgi:hypothetical protein